MATSARKPGDVFPPELLRLLGTAQRGIDQRVNRKGRCAACASRWPCRQTGLAEFAPGALSACELRAGTTALDMPPYPVRGRCRPSHLAVLPVWRRSRSAGRRADRRPARRPRRHHLRTSRRRQVNEIAPPPGNKWTRPTCGRSGHLPRGSRRCIKIRWPTRVGP
jgi:hypothetical protein